MKLRALAIAAALAVMALPQVAAAGWGTITSPGGLNLRSCAGAGCSRVAVMPAGARVWIDGSLHGWYHVSYNGLAGYASGRHISATTVRVRRAPPLALSTSPAPPPPIPFGYWWADGHLGPWYDSSQWVEPNRPPDHPGFFLGFSLAQ